MMSSEERVVSLHKRMAVRRKRRALNRLSLGCSVLAVCLVMLIFSEGAHPGGSAGIYTGAAMLFNGVGPYVLIAVIAFMLGVLITVLLKSQSEKNDTSKNKKES